MESTRKCWKEVTAPVFCSGRERLLDGCNVNRVWGRVLRSAQSRGVCPLELQYVRHTWATLALFDGKSVRCVADQLDHSDPALMLCVYAHAMR